MNFQNQQIINEQESDIFDDDNNEFFDEDQLQPKNININQVEELLGLEISKIENQYQIMYQQAVKDLEDKFKNQNKTTKFCENCQNHNKNVKLKSKDSDKNHWKKFYEQEYQNNLTEMKKSYTEKINEANRMKSLLSVRMKKLSDQKKLVDIQSIEKHQIIIENKEKEIIELKQSNQNLEGKLKINQKKMQEMQEKIDELEIALGESQQKQDNKQIIDDEIQEQDNQQIFDELIEQKDTDSESEENKILLLPVEQIDQNIQVRRKKIKSKQKNSNYQKTLQINSSNKQIKKKQSNDSYLMGFQDQQNKEHEKFMIKERQEQLQNPLEQLFQGQIDTDDKKDIKMKTIRMQYISQKYKDKIFEQDFLKQVVFVKKQLLDIFLNTEENILKREELKSKIEKQINNILDFWDKLNFSFAQRLKTFQKFQNLVSLNEIQKFLNKETAKIKKIKSNNKQLIMKLAEINILRNQLFQEAQNYRDFQVFYQKNIKKLQKLNKILKKCANLDKSIDLCQVLQLETLLQIQQWEIQYLEKLMIQQNVIQKIKNL